MFEYFLYAAIVVETALAAFVYKSSFRDPELIRFNLYFGIFYCAFLAWCIIQIKNFQRRRKLADAEPVATGHTRTALGLTSGQLAIAVVVFVAGVATFSWMLRLLR